MTSLKWCPGFFRVLRILDFDWPTLFERLCTRHLYENIIFRMASRILNSNLRRMVVLTSSRTQFFGGTKVNITFVNRAQKEFQVKAREGDTVLDTVLDNMIEYDGEHDLNFMT